MILYWLQNPKSKIKGMEGTHVSYLVVLAECGVELFHVRELITRAAFRAGAQRRGSELLVLLLRSNEDVQ